MIVYEFTRKNMIQCLPLVYISAKSRILLSRNVVEKADTPPNRHMHPVTTSFSHIPKKLKPFKPYPQIWTKGDTRGNDYHVFMFKKSSKPVLEVAFALSRPQIWKMSRFGS